jgi:hypothetical protein
MANTVTLADLKLRARERADMVNSNFISDSELNSFVNSAYSELYDLIVSRFEDYYTTSTSATVASGASSIPLPSDFYKFRGLDRAINASTGDYYSVDKFNFRERNSRNRGLLTSTRGVTSVEYRLVGSVIELTPENSAPGTYKLWYVPTFTRLTTDTDTVDGINGYEEYIVVDAAIKMLSKEESDVSVLVAEKRVLAQRIEDMAQQRDMDQAEVITDSYSDNDSFGDY